MKAYHHEVRLGVQHAGSDGFVPVVEADHVESDRLRYRQDERHHPDGHDFEDCEQRDADSLHSAPGRDGSVPETWRHRVKVQAYQID